MIAHMTVYALHEIQNVHKLIHFVTLRLLLCGIRRVETSVIIHRRDNTHTKRPNSNCWWQFRGVNLVTGLRTSEALP